MELDAIAAVAVGGTPFTGGQASVVGTLIGALLIQLVRYTLLANGVPGRRGAGGQGGDHRRRGLVAAAEQVYVSAATANPATSAASDPPGLGGATARRDRARRC